MAYKKRVTWLVASIVIVFAACWFPIQIMLILMRLKSHKITATYVAVQVFAHTLGYMNSCVNPIVYAFASETFNQSFKKSWLARWFFCYCCSSSSSTLNTTASTNQTNNNNNNSQSNQLINGLAHSTNNNNCANLQAFRHSTSSPAENQCANMSAGARRGNRQNSLQPILTSGLIGHNSNDNESRSRNQSLNHIFTATDRSGDQQRQAQVEQASRPTLEPRDRATGMSSSKPLRSGPAQAQASTPTPTPTPTPTNYHSIVINSNPLPSQEGVNRSSQTDEDSTVRQRSGVGATVKEQLVARVISQPNNGNQIVAHRCEPHDQDY